MASPSVARKRCSYSQTRNIYFFSVFLLTRTTTNPPPLAPGPG